MCLCLRDTLPKKKNNNNIKIIYICALLKYNIFHILFCCCVMFNCFKVLFPHINLHSIQHNSKAKKVF